MPPRKVAGFTLVELLVSIAVLILLVALLLEVFSSATATATMSRKHIDADEAARLVFDRMGADFACMVKRPDVNYIFYKQPSSTGTAGNDAMFFYAEAPGYLDPSASLTTSGSTSGVALVGYRINQSNQFYPNSPVIERLGENLTWNGVPDTSGTTPGGMVFLPQTLAANWLYAIGGPPYNLNTEHYQVLSDMVFRMEFCFLLKSGSYAISGTTASTGTTGYSNAPTAVPTTVPQPFVTSNYFTGSSQSDYAGNVYGFPPDLNGIVVTIAVLDDSSRKVVSKSNIASMAAALNDSLPSSPPSGANSTPGITTVGNVQANPQLTAQIWWQDQLSQPSFAQGINVPRAALSQVRVYERTFYFNKN